MTRLDAAAFDAFFGEIYTDRAGRRLSPFPWQRRLVRRILGEAGDRRGWPRYLALPTASGKTAAIDVAIYTLACQADDDPGSRSAPRRIFFVVDRRVIVDEAFERARDLALKLATARDGVLAEVADRLRRLAGGPDAQPLEAFELRGGIYRDDAWARSPLQPTVIASTVDQVGSRLLHRGYGVSSRGWPIHAGLVAHDALILLDEAHCSRPFSETLAAVGRYRQWADEPLPTPFACVEMTATPRGSAAEADVFRLEAEDHEDPELGRRLRASKPAKLLPPVAGKGGSSRMIETLRRQAEELARAGARRIALLVNRVETARRIHADLDPRAGDAVLMVGRMRPWDRDRLLDRWRPHLTAGPTRTPHDRPIFVAATQCLEVGANLDFDALVTECASLDALRQRFGRLNRLGRDEGAAAAVAVAADDLKPGSEDPVYGEALRETWSWLAAEAAEAEAGVDFGITALDDRWRQARQRQPDLGETLAPPAPRAPVMLPAHLDAWVQTSPVPQPDPDLEMFLHGAERGAPEVQVCWRRDLEVPAEGAPEATERLASWIDTVARIPPSSAECMPVPLYVVVRWLRGANRPGAGMVDVEGSVRLDEGADEDEGTSETPRRTILCWRGPDDSGLADRDHPPRPGDTLVIPAALGGWNDFGHVPELADGRLPADLAEVAHFTRRRIALLRLHPALIESWPPSDAQQKLLGLATKEETEITAEELEPEAREHLAALGEGTMAAELAEVIAELLEQGFRASPHPSGRGWVLSGKRRALARDLPAERGGVGRREPEGGGEASETFTTDDDSASATTEVPLTDHCLDVANLAGRFADGCGLPPKLRNDLLLAGRYHDLGKADHRFQAWLHGGSTLAAELAPTLLAKSGGLPEDRRERERARRRAGFPASGRHELLSVRLVESGAQLASASDPDLVLHLIASHHGRCRPFAPVVEDDQPVETRIEHDGSPLVAISATGLESLDSGVAERFWRLVRRYGWWGIALIESILRLADHRQSEAEELAARSYAQVAPSERRSA